MTVAYIRYISLLTRSLSIVYSLPIAMSKRKTRKEKVIAQLRRKISQTQNTNNTETHSSVLTSSMYSLTKFSDQKLDSTAINATPYFYSDLLKTLMVTAAIIGSELILYLLIYRNSLKIPVINF